MKSDKFLESTLSASGEARREVILLDVQAAMRRRRQHRTLARRVALGVAASGIAAGLLLGLALTPVGSPGGGVQVATVTAFERIEFERIEADKQAPSWTTLPSKPVDTSQHADDEEFLALLAEAGCKAGFVRVEGKVLLAVADGGFVGLE